MKQALIRLGFGLSFSLALLNCKGRPSDADCKKAIANIQALLGTDKSLSGYDLEGQVRRCRGGARVESVRCAIAAKTLDQLAACNLVDVSVARGSANPTPATGSAQVPTAGSANPTPATGSAAQTNK